MSDSITCVNSIFEQPWWLDAVAPGRWAAAEVIRGGACVGRLPYVFGKRYGMRYIGTPSGSMFSGPWIKETGGKPGTYLGYQKEIMLDLIDALPKGNTIIRLSPERNYYLPFLWRGYSVSPCFTYRIEQTDDIKKVWEDLDKGTRKAVKKGMSELTLREDLPIDVLIDLENKTFRRQNRTHHSNSEQLERVFEACKVHKAGTLMCAVDSKERVHTANLYVYDNKAVYAIRGGSDPKLRSSQSDAFLTWKGIELAASMGVAFDFEGSSIENIEQFFRSFGGKPLIYYSVSRNNAAMSFANYMKPKVKKMLGWK